MTFEAFVWGPRFLTGIPVIDVQHQRLVELIKSVGEVLVDDTLVDLPEIVARSAYANHFRAEGGVWHKAEHRRGEQALHQEAHLDFVTSLIIFTTIFRPPKTRHSAQRLPVFMADLSHFCEDHAMARRALAELAEPAGHRPADVPFPLLPDHRNVILPAHCAALTNADNDEHATARHQPQPRAPGARTHASASNRPMRRLVQNAISGQRQFPARRNATTIAGKREMASIGQAGRRRGARNK
ncbi:MAG: hypothetical protein IPP85_19200 [Propionivibrio sp.]|nr:hypothetical protein [Propionivibrio sp.]